MWQHVSMTKCQNLLHLKKWFLKISFNFSTPKKCVWGGVRQGGGGKAFAACHWSGHTGDYTNTCVVEPEMDFFPESLKKMHRLRFWAIPHKLIIVGHDNFFKQFFFKFICCDSSNNFSQIITYFIKIERICMNIFLNGKITVFSFIFQNIFYLNLWEKKRKKISRSQVWTGSTTLQAKTGEKKI